MNMTSNKSIWLTWLPAASFIFFQFILQVFPSVILEDLEQAFRVNLVQIGNMSALFYYAFAFSLIPVGILMDRFSIQKTLTFSIWLCSLGSFIFAISYSLEEASFARILMGIGGSAAFVGTMRLVAICFPLEKIGLASGLTVASAMIGAIVGQTVLGHIINIIGWRASLWIVTLLGILIGFSIIIIMKGLEKNKTTNSKNNIWQDLYSVVGNTKNWSPALYASLIYIPLPVFAGLWGVPFFYNVYHFSHIFSAFLCSFVWLGMGIGSPILGLISDRFNNRRTLMIWCPWLVSIITIIILYGVITNKLFVILLMLFMGFFCGAYSLSFSELRSIVSTKVSGTAVAFVMTIVMVMIAAITQVIGLSLNVIKAHQFNFASLNTLSGQYQLAATVIPILVFSSYFLARLLMKSKHVLPIKFGS
jgi:MFS family permease